MGKKTDTDTLKARGSSTARKRTKATKTHPKQPEGCPAAPSWLTSEARQLWDEHAGEIYELGALGILDRIAVAQLFTAMAEHQRHAQVVEREGAVVVRDHYEGPHPEAKLRDDAAKRVATLLRYCGLTRSSRVTMTLDEPEEKPAKKKPDNVLGFAGFAT